MLRGFIGFYWVLLGFTVFLPGVTGLYRLLPGFVAILTGFDCAGQGFTGLDWVCLNFLFFPGFFSESFGVLSNFLSVLPGFTGFYLVIFLFILSFFQESRELETCCLSSCTLWVKFEPEMRTLGWILMTSIFLMIFFRLFFPFYFLLRAETEQDLAIPPPPDLASLLRASGDFRTQAADLAPIYANPSLVRRRQCGIRNPESGMAAMIVEFFDLCFFSSHLISMKWVT